MDLLLTDNKWIGLVLHDDDYYHYYYFCWYEHKQCDTRESFKMVKIQRHVADKLENERIKIRLKNLWFLYL